VLRGASAQGKSTTPPTVLTRDEKESLVRIETLWAGQVVLESLTLLRGHSEYHGGAIYCSNAAARLHRVHVLDGRASQAGGGIYASDADLILEDVVMKGNVAQDSYGGWPRGGAIAAGSSSLSLRRVIFERNHTSGGFGSGEGGALTASHCDVVIEDAVFRDNSAGGDWASGGAIEVWETALRIEGALFRGNRVQGRGGAISASMGGPIDISHSVFLENRSICCPENGSGGAVSAAYARLRVRYCSFEDNEAHGYSDDYSVGGAIRALSGPIELLDSVFRGNQAHTRGGAASLDSDSWSAVVKGCIFTDNSSSGDGGALSLSGADATLENIVATGNYARRGGGVYATRADSITIRQCTLVDNEASHASGAIYVEEAHADVRNSIVWGNEGGRVGGPGSVAIHWSLIEGGFPGIGNIDTDPLLYHQRRGLPGIPHPGSPCIDAGDPELEDQLSDQHPLWPPGHANGTRSDMGAYGGPENRRWLESPALRRRDDQGR